MLQRHEEPKTANDEYEQGTYVYFDYNIIHDDQQVCTLSHCSDSKPHRCSTLKSRARYFRAWV